MPECRERFTLSRLSLTSLPLCPCPPFLPLLQAGGLAHVGSCWRRWYRYLGGRSRRGSLRRYIFERSMMGQMGYQGAQILQSLYPGPRRALGP